MECIAPDEINEEQLLAYADGEADKATLQHVQRCQYCAQKAFAYAADQWVLRTLFHRVECPDIHTLSECGQGLQLSDEHSTVERHVRDCPLCTQEIADLRRFLLEAPVTHPLAPARGQLKRLVARLTPPLSPGPSAQGPALAFRGAATPADIYQAEDIKVVVGLEADGLRAGRKMLLGFTTREGQPLNSLTGAQVELTRQGETIATEWVDELGNFVFSDLISGEYELILATDLEQVFIEAVVV